MNYKTLIQIFITIILSAVISIWILQNNSNLQKKLITHIVSFLEKEWDASIEIKQAHANFFTQSIYFTDGAIDPKKHKCYWNFTQGKVTTSIFDILFKKQLPLHLTFINVSGETDYANNQLAIVNHLEDIFETKQSDFKVSPRSVTIQNINAKGTWNNQSASILMKGSFTFYKNNKNDHSSKRYELRCSNSSIFINKSPLIIGLDGKGSLEKKTKASSWIPVLDMVGNLITPKKQYAVAIKNNNHSVSITNKTKTINTIGTFGEISKLKGTLPGPLLEYWARIAGHSTTLHNYSPLLNKEVSSFSLTFKNGTNAPEITGRLSLKNNPIFPSIRLRNLLLQKNFFTGTLQAKTFNGIDLTGTIDYTVDGQSGSISLTNKSEIALHPTTDSNITTWNIPANQAQIVAKILPPKNPAHPEPIQGPAEGGFYLPFHDILSKKTTILQGNFICTPKEMTIRGCFDTNKFIMIIALDPHPHLKRLEYINDEHDTSLISLIQNKQNPFLIEGHIAFTAIQSFLPLDMQHAILGKDSTFSIKINQESLCAINTSISLEEGTLYLPESHNLLEHFTLNAIMHPLEKKIYFSNGTLQFHKGIINCPHAMIAFEPNFTFKTIHLPLEINDLFINWKKDLYAFVYGNVLVTKKSTTPIDITGNILLKKSLLKNDIFTEQSHDAVYLPTHASPFSQTPMRIALNIATESPLKIKTPTLNTHATLAFNVNHSMSKDEFNIPQVSGYINLEKGSLKLLTQSLMIEYGRLEFPTHQSHDPIIEFTAKNRIQKYLITLHATGTLQKPIITLESFPELQEEQILSLLLGGAEGNGLQTDIATIVLHNLNAILMGTRQFNQKTNALFKFLTRPLKYVQIVPNFTDQSGRGGIRGIISIDINKQLHAQLQKNFNLQEDFLFQIQYMLADEINIKAIKDSRDELGAELELRFKL